MATNRNIQNSKPEYPVFPEHTLFLDSIKNLMLAMLKSFTTVFSSLETW
jgi:hypothetical protein